MLARFFVSRLLSVCFTLSLCRFPCLHLHLLSVRVATLLSLSSFFFFNQINLLTPWMNTYLPCTIVFMYIILAY